MPKCSRLGRRERARFGSTLNDGAWGHVDVSGNGTVMIEMRDVPVELAVRTRGAEGSTESRCRRAVTGPTS